MDPKLIDARGKRCPLPIIETAKEVAKLELGQTIELLSDDPATQNDLAAWARMTGNQSELIEVHRFKITKLS